MKIRYSLILLMLTFTAVGCIPQTTVTPTTVVTPHSVIIQVSTLAPTYSPATVAGWITSRTCNGGDVILQDIANADGTLATAYLDAIVPTLSKCFTRVFVGTVDIPGSATDPAFQDRYLTASKSVALAFAQRYPSLSFNWYLTHEANLNDLYYNDIAAAYQSLFTAEVRDLSAIRPTAQYAWSPAFWFPYSSYSLNTAGMAQLRTNISGLLSAVPIQLLDLQDYVGGSSCQPSGNHVTPQDALNWASFAQSLPGAHEVKINAEQYNFDCGSGNIVAADQTEVNAREAKYGNRLGPSWEIRFWVTTH